MGEIRGHRDLEAWQVGMSAVTETYLVSAEFPRSEMYGLTAQIRRAAISVPSNVAEGQARGGRAGLNHLGIALGSLAEVDTQLEVSLRLRYVSGERAATLQKLIVSERRLLSGLRRAKRARLGLSLIGPASLLFIALRLFA
jgi:four helix bundle protein